MFFRRKKYTAKQAYFRERFRHLIMDAVFKAYETEGKKPPICYTLDDAADALAIIDRDLVIETRKVPDICPNGRWLDICQKQRGKE